jgi:hypothetical protein
MTALVAVETLLLALLALLVAGLLRSHAEILRRLAALGAGDEESAFEPGLARPRADTPAAHDLAGATLAGEVRTVSVAGEGGTLLAFLTSGCSICHEFWTAFADGRPLPGGARLVVVTKDAHEERPRRLARLAPPGVTVLLSSQAWEDYRVPVAPYFVHVAGGRVLGEGSAREWAQLRSLFGDAVEDAATSGRSTAERALRVEHDLRSAGIGPGDPSLYRLEDGPVEPEEAAS